MTSRASISLWSAPGLAVTALALAAAAARRTPTRPAARQVGHGVAAGAGHHAEPVPGPAGFVRDILVRMTTNGQPATTQQLGGAWSWDTKTSTCETPVDAVIATAPANAGNCTQVAYAASNPGYKLTVSPAPALKKVLASKGQAC